MPLNEGYSPRNRAERVIAAGRLFFPVFLAGAILLDPTEPRPHAPLVLQLAAGYLVYAGGLGLLVWQRRATTAALSFVTHAVDLVLFSAFMHVTDSTSSPFFVYFIFATLTGPLRWHGAGALLTGAVGWGLWGGGRVGTRSALWGGGFGHRGPGRITDIASTTGPSSLLSSDRTRRAILQRLSRGETRVTELAGPFDMSLNAVSKQIRVLERAQLVNRRVLGREHLLSLNARPLDDAARWIETHRKGLEGAPRAARARARRGGCRPAIIRQGTPALS